MRTKYLAFALAALLFAWTPAALAQTGCPTSGSGVSCFGGQYFCAANGSCMTPVTSCPQNQVLDCIACGCTCPAGTTVCNNSGSGNYQKCIANRTCPNGMTWDVCTDTCVTPYVLLSPGAVQTGAPSLNGSLTLTGKLSLGGDILLPTGKAVRVDAAGATTLNFGNWAVGATGFAMNVFGNLAATSTNTNTLCLSGTCRTTWPASGDYSSTFVDVSGDTMTGTLFLNGSPSLVTTGDVGIGTAYPGGKLGVVTSGAGSVAINGWASGMGVSGTATAVGGSGVYAHNSAASGATYGVQAVDDSSTGYAIYANNTAGGYGVYSAAGTNYFSGNVGLGTTGPAYKLDVVGGIRSQDYGGAGSVNVMIGDDTFLTDIDVGNITGLYGAFDSTVGGLKLGSGGPYLFGSSGRLGVNTTSPAVDFSVKQSSNANGGPGGMQIVREGGNTDNWRWNLDSINNFVFAFNGSWRNYMNTSGGWYTTSDRSLKKDVMTSSHGLDDVLALRAVTFRYKDQKAGSPLQYGFIAQEVKPILPDLVGEKDGLLSLNYNEFAPVLVKAVQELSGKLDATVKLDAAGRATVGQLEVKGEISAPNNHWGGAERRQACHAGADCLCDDGWYMVGITGANPPAIICRQL